MPCKAQAKNAKTSHSWAGFCLVYHEEPTASLRQLVTPLQYLA